MNRWRRSRSPQGEEQAVSPRDPDAEPGNTPADAAEEVAVVRTSQAGSPVVKEVRMEEAQDRSDVSVVGPGTRIEGTVVATGSLRVDGEVKGRITAQREVALTAGGRVEADIDANSITLAGRVKGDLTARADVTLPAESRLDGDIRAQNVEVGGAVNGEIVATGRVRLGSRARVEGDITSKALAIAEGAVFIGTSVMEQEGREGAEARKGEQTAERQAASVQR
jgi:cytoskeletal protein CcmA (bactofilin family)